MKINCPNVGRMPAEYEKGWIKALEDLLK